MLYLYFLQAFYDIISIFVIVALWLVIIRMRKMIWKPTPSIRVGQEDERELRLIFSEGGHERMLRMRRLAKAADDAEVIDRATKMYEWYLTLPFNTRIGKLNLDGDKVEPVEFEF